jgi:hypothetical protein
MDVKNEHGLVIVTYINLRNEMQKLKIDSNRLWKVSSVTNAFAVITFSHTNDAVFFCLHTHFFFLRGRKKFASGEKNLTNSSEVICSKR